MTVILDFETFLFVSFVGAKMKGDILHFSMSDQFQERIMKRIFQSGKQTKGKPTFHDKKRKKKKGKMSSCYHRNTEAGHDINC